MKNSEKQREKQKKRKKQKKSKQAIKVISKKLVEVLSKLLDNNSRFIYLIILLKGSPKFWKFRWVLKSISKLKRRLKIKIYLDRTLKVYGLVRPAKLRRV